MFAFTQIVCEVEHLAMTVAVAGSKAIDVAAAAAVSVAAAITALIVVVIAPTASQMRNGSS